MLTAKLTRKASTDDGTFGTLEYPGGKCLTLELPDRTNAPDRSRILSGTYKCAVRQSPKFGSVYALDGVSGRTDILIHPANWAGDVDKGRYSELHGCIALGEGMSLGATPHGNLQKMLTGSKAAVAAFMQAMGEDPFLLTII